VGKEYPSGCNYVNLDEVLTGYINRDPGVMSRGLRKLEVRLEEDRKLQTKIGKLQLGIRKDRKVKIATRQG